MKSPKAAAVAEPAPIEFAPWVPGADRLLTIDTVAAIVGCGRATIYRMIAAGKFPRSVAIVGESKRRAGTPRKIQIARWSANEVQAWIAEQLAARSE